MKKVYVHIERNFEKLTLLATKMLGNSISFLVAVMLVLFWWTTGLFRSDNWHDNIGDFIFGTTFLSMFIIQKSFNRYSALVHLKINELIASNEAADNAVIDDTQKIEHDIRKKSKEYIESDETEEIIGSKINKRVRASKSKVETW